MGVNDNYRPTEVYDDEGFQILEKWGDMGFLNKLLKMRPGAAVGYCCDPVGGRKLNSKNYADWRSLSNFLWFVKFEHRWREEEANRKREDMGVVK